MKITCKDFRYICGLTKKHFIQTLLNYDLLVMDGYCVTKATVPMWLYLLAFIPVHFCEALMCMWDGGLKNFEICRRTLIHYTFQKGDIPYERAKEIYEKN